MANKFYNISGNYKAAKEQAQTQIELEITDQIKQQMIKTGLSSKAIESTEVGYDWDTERLDDTCVEVLIVTITFDADENEPTLAQGEALEIRIEWTFNPDEAVENPIVFTNEPYTNEDNGKEQHMIQFQIDLDM